MYLTNNQTTKGVARRLKELGQLEHCYCTETRPYNQGMHSNFCLYAKRAK